MMLLVLHSLVAAHLFMVVGTTYEHQGIRYHTQLRVDGCMWWSYLLVLLYNIVCMLSPSYPLCYAVGYGGVMERRTDIASL